MFGTNNSRSTATDVLFGTANSGAVSCSTGLLSTQDFDFTVGGTGQPSYYVSGLTWTTRDNALTARTPPGTPIPGAVWLFGTVIAGGAGYGRWRKKRKAATNAA